ncbi:MAG: hypothetical protein H0V17_21910, partial [Deltaproteobacteria bacterium]|nr:hypothetical protein [Deltaproteobacteria bacterium]
VVIARDPTPALPDVLRSELATPIELAVTPAIFIERLVQRLAGAPPPPIGPSLPAIGRGRPNRHRKSLSVVMQAPLEADLEPIPPVTPTHGHQASVRISSTMSPVNVDQDDAIDLRSTSLGMPPPRAPSRAAPVIQIPERGSAPNPLPSSDGSGPMRASDGSGAKQRPSEGSGAKPRPDSFETRTPPIGSRNVIRMPPRIPPMPPKPTSRAVSEGVSLELDADEPPPPERLRPTREIPAPDLEAVLGEAAQAVSQPPSNDFSPAIAASTRPTRPAIIVPSEAMEAVESERVTRQNLSPPQRATPNLIKRPPTPLPVAPQPQTRTLKADDDDEPHPADASIRPTRPKLEPPSRPPPPTNYAETVRAPLTTPPTNDAETVRASLTPPPPTNDAETMRASLSTPPPEAMKDAQPARTPTFGKIATDLSIVREIERALSRATADRLLMKHAATRWNALLLVTVANERARGARGHGARLMAGVESIELAIAASSLLQAALDPAAALPAGKDPLFDLLGGPADPSSAAVVVNDRVVAVLAAGDAINGGNLEELRALASALSVAYQRFSAKP